MWGAGWPRPRGRTASRLQRGTGGEGKEAGRTWQGVGTLPSDQTPPAATRAPSAEAAFASGGRRRPRAAALAWPVALGPLSVTAQARCARMSRRRREHLPGAPAQTQTPRGAGTGGDALAGRHHVAEGGRAPGIHLSWSECRTVLTYVHLWGARGFGHGRRPVLSEDRELQTPWGSSGPGGPTRPARTVPRPA